MGRFGLKVHARNAPEGGSTWRSCLEKAALTCKNKDSWQVRKCSGNAWQFLEKRPGRSRAARHGPRTRAVPEPVLPEVAKLTMGEASSCQELGNYLPHCRGEALK